MIKRDDAEKQRLLDEAKRMNQARKDADHGLYMVLITEYGTVFVKDLEFFVEQGGLTQEWGDKWLPIEADSIEDARQRGSEIARM